MKKLKLMLSDLMGGDPGADVLTEPQRSAFLKLGPTQLEKWLPVLSGESRSAQLDLIREAIKTGACSAFIVSTRPLLPPAKCPTLLTTMVRGRGRFSYPNLSNPNPKP